MNSRAIQFLSTVLATVQLSADIPSVPGAPPPPPAAVSSMESSELVGFAEYPPVIQTRITEALALTKKNLTYTFGSSDPARGGMDCSGTIFHLLRKCGFKDTPRQSDQMCQWIMSQSTLHRTDAAKTLDDPAFAQLQSGDLVFWSGTYDATQRKLPITHVMMYLGKRKTNGKPVLFGASDGRSYEGQRRCGVSVLDLAIPKAGGKAVLHGYGSVPEIRPAGKSER